MAAQNQASNVSNASNQQQTSSSTQMTQRPSALPQRRGSYFPGFAITPQELFSSNPFSLFRRITQDMDRMFQGFGLERSSGGGAGAWSPAIEVFERDGKYHVCAELPGLSPDDIKVEVANDVLTIQGERKSEHEEKQGNLQRTEREYGSFFRTVPLPEGADIEHANAKFENGLLEVAVPVPQQKENRRSIPIQGQAKGREGTQAKAA